MVYETDCVIITIRKGPSIMVKLAVQLFGASSAVQTYYDQTWSCPVTWHYWTKTKLHLEYTSSQKKFHILPQDFNSKLFPFEPKQTRHPEPSFGERSFGAPTPYLRGRGQQRRRRRRRPPSKAESSRFWWRRWSGVLAGGGESGGQWRARSRNVQSFLLSPLS